MASTALAHQPKAVRTEVASIVRVAKQKAKTQIQNVAKVKVPLATGAGAGALGLLERLSGLETDVVGVDNGLVAGPILAVAGALMPPKWKIGEYIMLAGVGMLCSGTRTAARELGADSATTEGMG